jgi:hypothetical protein
MSRGHLATLAVVLATAAVLAQQTKPIENSDIVKMLKAGLGERVIVATIEQAPATAFDTSPDALANLKRVGVPETVLVTMIGARKAPVADSPAEPLTLRTPSAASRLPSGIYVELKTPNGRPNRIPLEPTTITRVRTRGGGARVFNPFATVETVAEVRGARAALRIPDPQPTFYFYFRDQGSLDPGPFVGWLAAASSPNEFALIEMYRESDRRELIIGKGKLFSHSQGIESENTVPMKVERLSPGEYRVTPDETFRQSGEFCFFYSAGAGSLVGAAVVGKLFDFGIEVPRAK